MSRSRASAAGVTWRLVTANAPWPARTAHTAVVDAAGAIYVIGGSDAATHYKDVWASTDGGARAGLGDTCGLPKGARMRHSRGTQGYSRADSGYSGGTCGLLKRYSEGMRAVL